MERSFVISYMTLRKAIGFLGILLPFVVVIGSFILDNTCLIQDSISDYYYTSMRNVFVGILCAVGLFLISYRGPEHLDNLLTSLSGVFIILTAFLPTSPTEHIIIHCCPTSRNVDCIGIVHLVSAGAFFAILAYMSCFIFTKPKDLTAATVQKLKRNRIYRVCGVIMFLSIVLIAISFIDAIEQFVGRFPLTLVMETIALFAFGLSWLVKGEALFPDKANSI